MAQRSCWGARGGRRGGTSFLPDVAYLRHGILRMLPPAPLWGGVPGSPAPVRGFRQRACSDVGLSGRSWRLGALPNRISQVVGPSRTEPMAARASLVGRMVEGNRFVAFAAQNNSRR